MLHNGKVIMTAEEFDEIFESQVDLCREILTGKAREYASEDRLHNFRKSAHLKSVSMRAALDGMMVKHIVSLFDMTGSDATYPLAAWNEKIGDALNYLFILKAIVTEELDAGDPIFLGDAEPGSSSASEQRDGCCPHCQCSV